MSLIEIHATGALAVVYAILYFIGAITVIKWTFRVLAASISHVASGAGANE